MGKSVLKDIEHIEERISDFFFKEEFGKNITVCDVIHNIISLWMDELETVIENNEKTCSSEKRSYYCLSSDGPNKVISMIPYDHLE